MLFGFGNLGDGLEFYEFLKSKRPDENLPLCSMLFTITLPTLYMNITRNLGLCEDRMV